MMKYRFIVFFCPHLACASVAVVFVVVFSFLSLTYLVSVARTKKRKYCSKSSYDSWPL